MAQKPCRLLKTQSNLGSIRVALRITVKVMMLRVVISRVPCRHLMLPINLNQKMMMKFMRGRVITTSARSVKNIPCILKMISIAITLLVQVMPTRNSCETPEILISHLREDQEEL